MQNSPIGVLKAISSVYSLFSFGRKITSTLYDMPGETFATCGNSSANCTLCGILYLIGVIFLPTFLSESTSLYSPPTSQPFHSRKSAQSKP